MKFNKRQKGFTLIELSIGNSIKFSEPSEHSPAILGVL